MTKNHSRNDLALVLLLGVGLPVAGNLGLSSLFPTLSFVQIPLHSVVETLGYCAGILLAILLIVQRKDSVDSGRYIWIASGLIGMGLLDGFHSIVDLGNSFPWLRSTSTLVGGLFFVLIWFNVPLRRIKTIPLLTAIGATALGIYSVVLPATIPAMLVDGVFTTAAVATNLVGGLFFIIAAIGFLSRYRAKPDYEEILFAVFCLLNGMAGLLFQSSNMWDTAWWFWHGLRLVAYLCLLAYVLVIFQRATVNLEERAADLARNNGVMQRIFDQIQATTQLLSSSASEILGSTTQVAAGTAESAASISQTTTTVEEVRQAAELSAQKAQYVSDNAQLVAQVSQDGQRAVMETSLGMERIREQMDIIAQTVVRLSEQSQSIGGIIAAVTDLAEQSNLLAVNAAIEAAKAGEQGRGFAVVAQEIKSLAEQSKQATTQVRNILSDVQRATTNAVMATEQGGKTVDAGVQQASQAGEAIRLLTESSDEAVQAATQIAASSQQQVVGMNQIGMAMENINQAGSQTAVNMSQIAVAARGLHELGEQLNDLTKQFKL